MSSQSPNLRDSLNGSAQLGRLNDILKALGLGDLLALAIRGLTATETGVVPSANVATLANAPTTLFQVNATAASSTGIKTLFIAPISGAGAYVPKAGECVWAGPGTKKVLFNAADAVTAVSFTYSVGTEAVSILPRQLGQSDSTF